MTLSSYHTHTVFCDGKNTAEEMILAAIEKGMPELGFSGHSPLQFSNDWCMSLDGEREYFNTVRELREKYKSCIKIYIGVEQDVNSERSSNPYDYIIGSVHGINKNGVYFDVDATAEQVRDNVEKLYGGDPYSYVEDYYSSVGDVYAKTGCDIIGHFDLVTKFLDIDPLFSEAHPRYIAARDKALVKLLNTPAVFEINTGAVYKGYRKSVYPAMDVIEKIAAHGKSFVINSDSHNTESIDFLLCSTAEELDKRNIKYLTSLDDVLKITRPENK